MPALSRLHRCLVSCVELEQFAVAFADLFFDVAIPPVAGQAVGSIGLFVEGDVVRAFEPDDEIAVVAVAGIAARGRKRFPLPRWSCHAQRR
jgi:hypothetical protein